MNLIYASDYDLNIFTPNYFNEQENIFKEIHYLEDEDLRFKFCSDQDIEKLNFNLVCNTNNLSENLNFYEYLDPVLNEKKCFYSYKKLKDFSCGSFDLEINYVEGTKDKQVKRSFVKQKQSNLINFILSKDPEKLNSLDLSYYLIVLNEVENKNSKESEKLYDVLKNKRDNSQKCFDSGNCDLKKTSNVLLNLILAGYEKNSRIVEDGKIYLNKKIISNDNNPSNLNLVLKNGNNESISCELNLDNGETIRNYIIDSDENKEINKDFSKLFTLNCNASLDEISYTIKDFTNKIIRSDTLENEGFLTEELEDFACFGEDECDYESTINALIVYGNLLDNSNLLETYIDLKKQEEDNSIVWLTENKFIDIGKYLFYKRDEKLTDYLKYRQNNDGSFDSGSNFNRVLSTSWAILGLQKSLNPNSEYVQDGKKWIYYNEPKFGWGSIEKNTLAYLAIKEKIKPYIISDFSETISKNVTYTLLNPTIYDLKNLNLKFKNPEVSSFLRYREDLGDLLGEDNISFKIEVLPNFFGKVSTDLVIEGFDGKNNKITLLEIPITIVGKDLFDFNLEEEYFVQDEFRNIDIKIEKIQNNENFLVSCNYFNPFSEKEENIEITQETSKISILNDDLKEGNFSISFDCIYDGISINKKLNLFVKKSNKTFDILENKLNVSSLDLDSSITLKNILSQKQIVSFEVIGDLKGVIEPLEVEKIIAPEDQREIFFRIKNKDYLMAILNTTKNNSILIKSDRGYYKEIPIVLNLKQENDEGLSIWLIVLFSVTLLFILLVIFRYVYLKRQENQMFEVPVQDDDDFEIDDDFDFK
jgi:hypothetical protein